MNIVPEKSVTRKHFDVGYALYVAKQSINRCQNIFQRRGWLAAQAGELAAADCDTQAYLSQAVR